MLPVCLVLVTICVLQGLNLTRHNCSICGRFHDCNPVELHKNVLSCVAQFECRDATRPHPDFTNV